MVIAHGQWPWLLYERAGEVVLVLGLSLGAAFLLRVLRRARSSGRLGRRAYSITAVIAGAGAFLCLYVSDRFYEEFAVRRLAVVLAVVLSGLTFGMFAWKKKLRPYKIESHDELPNY